MKCNRYIQKKKKIKNSYTSQLPRLDINIDIELKRNSAKLDKKINKQYNTE